MEFSVSNLSCRRGDRIVLEGVTFDVPAGHALILRGPNGSGKTTLLRCLAGLTPQVGGTMSFTPDHVAYAAHADGLKAQLSVSENLTFWSAVYGTSATHDAAQRFDLTMLLDRRAQDLSAGQKRRLSLARLMLTGRPLWALDEPTVSLDTASVALFADAVRDHLASGGMAIIATHIDLGLPDAAPLDIGPFRHDGRAESDPFLDEALS